MGVPDQSASLHIVEIADQLERLIDEHSPDCIITVPYEGGHPDHDAVALAASLACAGIDGWKRPPIIEMLSYHDQNGSCEMERFLNEEPGILGIELRPEEQEFKRRLFECFQSQQRVLCWFPVRIEKFRFAPRYDFLNAPHPGQLYYEKFPWGMDGAQWRELARAALTRRVCAY
jgi:LmbE family N-acetylglucosaminyl deacetylase